jgi:capsular polysaccharide biosynthesis protein
MTFKDALEILKKKFKLILAVCFGAVIIALVYNHYNPMLYMSSTSFLVDEEGVRKGDQDLNDQNIYSSESWPQGYRIYHMVRSTEMQDFLIDKFDLYKHYGISKESFMHYETIHAILKDRIGVSNIASGAIIVTFRGTDKFLVADVTNAIYGKLESMIKEHTIANMKRKIRIYSEILDNSKKEVDKRSVELRQTLSEFKTLVSERASSSTNRDLTEMSYKLGVLSDKVSTSYEDMIKTIKNNEITLAVSDKENLPNIKLITKALADTGPSLLYSMMMRVLIFVFIVLDLAVIIILLNNQDKEQEKFFFVKKSEKIRVGN